MPALQKWGARLSIINARTGGATPAATDNPKSCISPPLTRGKKVVKESDPDDVAAF
jgi:hypothetical protein